LDSGFSGIGFTINTYHAHCGCYVSVVIAVPGLLYPGTTTAEWHFPQENATFHHSKEGTKILELLIGRLKCHWSAFSENCASSPSRRFPLSSISVLLFVDCAFLLKSGYSIFDSALFRNQDAEWRFP
jgi:hypothetical protein